MKTDRPVVSSRFGFDEKDKNKIKPLIITFPKIEKKVNRG